MDDENLDINADPTDNDFATAYSYLVDSGDFQEFPRPVASALARQMAEHPALREASSGRLAPWKAYTLFMSPYNERQAAKSVENMFTDGAYQKVHSRIVSRMKTAEALTGDPGLGLVDDPVVTARIALKASENRYS